MIPFTSQAALGRTAAAMLLATAFCARAEHSYEGWRAIFNPAQQAGQVASAAVTDHRGNVFITGSAAVQSAAKTFYTAKYDGLDGHVVWERTYTTGTGESVANAIAIDGDGNVVVTGRESDANGIGDFHTIKYNGLTGALIWQKSYAGPQGGLDEALKVAVDSANNVIVTGKSLGSQYDFFTIKYSAATGATLWGGAAGGIRYNGGGNRDDIPADLAVDSANNVIVTGKSFLDTTKPVIYSAKYSAATGALLWGGTARTVATAGDAEGVSVAVDRNDNVAVLGMGRNANNTRYFYTVEYEKTSGNTIFSPKIHQSLGDDFNGGPASVAFDSAGSVVVTGTTVDNSNFSKNSYYTAKYAGATATAPGALLWEKLSPSRDDTDRAKRVVVDGANNVVVTGFSNDKTNHAADYYTVKYSGETGIPLWEQLYDGVGNDDLPAGLAVDDGGNVVVIGTSKLNFGNTNIRYDRIVTIKYNRLLLETGEDSPVADGVPDGAKFSAISPPAIGDNGAIAAKVTVAAGRKKVDAILAQGPQGGSTLVAVQGGDAPGVSGATYKSFYEPLISDKLTGSDHVAFVAKMAGVPGNKSTGVWVGDLNGSLKLALQQGTAIPGLNGELLKSVSSLSWRAGELVALITVSGSGVKGPNSTVLLGYNVTAGGTKLLRTGDMITVNGTAAAIKSISVLSPVSGSAGQGRSQSNTLVVARVTLADKRTALVSVNTAGAVVVKSLLASEQSGVGSGTPADAAYKSFGLPIVGSAGANFAALSTFAGKSINAGNDTALVFSSNGTQFAPFAREDDTAADAGTAKYKSFFDPLVNSLGDVAFLGTLDGKDVTTKNKTALWWGKPGTALEIVARTGFPATETSGAPGLALYTGFSSTALPGGVKAGPIFLATLGGEDVSKSNNLGLWAVDTTGAVRRLLRTGDTLKTSEFDGDEQVIKTVSGMTLLQSLPGAFGATRSFNETGAVAVLVNFTDRTQAVIHVGIP